MNWQILLYLWNDERSISYLLSCLEDVKVVTERRKLDALTVETFGTRIEKLISLRTSPIHSKDRTSIDDFEIIKPISRRAFGRIFLAKKRTTGDFFAIKGIEPTLILEMRMHHVHEPVPKRKLLTVLYQGCASSKVPDVPNDSFTGKLSYITDDFHVLRWDSVYLDERLTFVEEPVFILTRDVRQFCLRETSMVKFRFQPNSRLIALASTLLPAYLGLKRSLDQLSKSVQNSICKFVTQDDKTVQKTRSSGTELCTSMGPDPS
ncbi:hypothetical protein FXO37_08152 [Capsicum annuum]|nr:hypothetical protein FXO37_08152 [Capsicum annuum]